MARSRSRRLKNTTRTSPGIRSRLRRAWRRNRGLFLCGGVACVFLFILLFGMLARQEPTAPAPHIVEIEVPGSTEGIPPSPMASAEPDTTASPAVTAGPAPSPALGPTPTPAPPDFDKLISFYELKTDKYYNEQGYSSNHYDYTEDELYMLAQVIYGEARGESKKGKIAVANVVMNRVLSRGYPGKTIKAVITTPGQFTGYSPSRRPSAACIYAARQVLDYEVWVIPQHVYFFNSNRNRRDGEDWGKHKFYARIGVHAFYTENYRGRNRNGKIPPALYERAYKWPQYGCQPGKRVHRIQYMLNKLGYDVKADGYFGKTSKDALIAFQKAHRMKADGVAGPATIKALVKAFGVSEYSARFGG